MIVAVAMAGALRVTFGTMTVILGVLLLLAGLAAAGYGYLDEMEHKEESGPLGVAHDDERSELNQGLMVGGGVAATLGLVLLVVGIVVTASGKPKVEVAGAAAAKPEKAVANRPVSVVWVVAIVGGLLLVLLAGALLVPGGAGDNGNGLFSGKPEQRMLGEDQISGSVGATFTILGGSQMPASSASSEAVPVPAGTARAEVEVSWVQVDGGAEQLQVTVQVLDGDEWVDAAERTGPSGMLFDVLIDAPTELRLRVFPGEDGVVRQQDYTADIRFWNL